MEAMITPQDEERRAMGLETARTCLRTLSYCLRWGGALADSDQLLTLLDCAQVCQGLADRLGRGEAPGAWLEGCAQACERCARACGRYDDLELRECAEVCRYCAPTCRRVF